MGGKGVIMRKTVSVILNEGEGSVPLIKSPRRLKSLYLKTVFLFSQLAADKLTLQCLQLVGQVDFHQIRIKETCVFRPECIHLLICIADDFRKCGQRKVPAVFYDGLQQFLTV